MTDHAATGVLLAGRQATFGVVLVAGALLASVAARVQRGRARAELVDRSRTGSGCGRRVPPPRRSVPAALDVWRTAARAVGAPIRRVAGRPNDVLASQWVGSAVLLGAISVACGSGPVIASVVGVAAWAVPVAGAVARRSRARAVVVDELPEVVDLVRLGIGSGLNVRLAIDAVVRHHHGRIADVLHDALARTDRGERLADALDTGTAGLVEIAPLVDALVAAERYGAPLVSSLDRVATDARLVRRRRREEAARRVPVKLLFPLVFCTLPAFALLTVVPVLLRSLPSLAP